MRIVEHIFCYCFDFSRSFEYFRYSIVCFVFRFLQFSQILHFSFCFRLQDVFICICIFLYDNLIFFFDLQLFSLRFIQFCFKYNFQVICLFLKEVYASQSSKLLSRVFAELCGICMACRNFPFLITRNLRGFCTAHKPLQLILFIDFALLQILVFLWFTIIIILFN